MHGGIRAGAPRPVASARSWTSPRSRELQTQDRDRQGRRGQDGRRMRAGHRRCRRRADGPDHRARGPTRGRAGFGHESATLSYEPRRACSTTARAAAVDARRVKPDDALVEYLGRPRHGPHGQAARAARGCSTSSPGPSPASATSWSWARSSSSSTRPSADLILLDAPATGHAVTLLTSAAGMADVARAGPVRRQADEVVAMLADPAPLPGHPGDPGRGAPRHRGHRGRLPDRGPGRGGARARDRQPGDRRRAPASGHAGGRGRRGRRRRARRRSPTAALDEAAAFRRHRAERCAAALERLRRELPLELLVLPELERRGARPRRRSAQLADALALTPSRSSTR